LTAKNRSIERACEDTEATKVHLVAQPVGLRGGILNKAQRAALKLQLPVGLGYVEDEIIHLDPDAQVQHAFRVLFATFKRTGAAWATVKYFGEQQLLFPHRIRTGPHVQQLVNHKDVYLRVSSAYQGNRSPKEQMICGSYSCISSCT
jgi:hypothetical protein